MQSISLKNMGAVFGKKEREPHKEEDDDLDASEFEEEETGPKKEKSKRPKETPFTQQRIAALNPVVTPKRVVPLYLFLAVIFVCFGAGMVTISSKVDQVLIYYDGCSTKASSDWETMNSSDYSWSFHKNKTYNVAPTWRYVPGDGSNVSATDGACQIRFTTPYDLPKSVYLSYWIEKFYGNHRRYVLSFSEDQIHGQNTTISDLKDVVGINCKPLVSNGEGKQYYPCGLIANAMFNDTFPMQLSGFDGTESYPLTNEGISWSTDKDRFRRTKLNYTLLAPPPNWIKRYPNGYNSTNVPDIHNWEEFQNWMRTPAFPTFQRLIRRNDNSSLPAGNYEVDIGLNWPVTEFGGRKAIFMTHGSSIGAKNSFLGVVYLIGGFICVAMALVIFSFAVICKRSSGDVRYLSWNK
ncbi:LAMI_0G06590g1_1 [Lachancea mirantina]|uniref:LAMI_0G06590g1_1 n=1 Tax=Lachancea mirantina TaxID=1230905 RepID=A0A1G4K978_9SACH|nr:LAMI_0G06590g1_1 [Lachancea mirantina]